MNWSVAHRMGLVAVVTIAAGVPSSPASAQVHPHEDVYSYRVKDFALEPPWHSYPEGREREQWECFDDATKMTIACSLAGGSLDKYRFIFQRDTNKLRFLPSGGGFSGGGLY